MKRTARTMRLLPLALACWALLAPSRPAGAAPPNPASPFGFHPAGVYQEGYPWNGYGDALQIGVKWTRVGLSAYWFLVQPDLARQQYDFSLTDLMYGSVPADLTILANIEPQGKAAMGYTLPGSYLPVDTGKYEAFVRATVERYDGDGVADMPGLANPILHWQVGNEPDPIASGGFDLLQAMTYRAVKEACPSCTVVIGGVPGMSAVDAYLQDFNRYYAPILTALGGESVDVVDFHWYGMASGDYRGVKEIAAAIRGTLDAAGFAAIPIWVTEMGSYSGDPSPGANDDYPYQSEAQQAGDYVKRFVYGLASGLARVFAAFGLMEGASDEDWYFDHTGLIYDGQGSSDLGLGVKKLGYHSYRKMTEVLEGSDWGSAQVVRDSGQVVVVRFTKNGKPLFVAWYDYFLDPAYSPGTRKRVTLTGLSGSRVIATEAVPAVDTGLEVADYGTAFRRRVLDVRRGRATVSLGTSPVYVQTP